MGAEAVAMRASRAIHAGAVAERRHRTDVGSLVVDVEGLAKNLAPALVVADPVVFDGGLC